MTDRDEAIEAAERLIRDERQRQISAEGWTAEHDAQHDDGSLLHVAVFYYRHAIGDHIAMRDDGAPLGWPWDKEWWKPKEPVRNLVRAGALCMAERVRLWRIEMKYASAATRRMALSYNWWPAHVKQKYDAVVEKLAAALHRPEPQTAPASCPNCADETDCSNVRQCRAVEEAYAAPADAERLALAENIEKYCKAIDEAGEKGWRGAVMGDRVELGRLTHENRNLIISSLRAGGRPEDEPQTAPASIVTCCVTGAIPGDGGACGDCDPCIMGEASVPVAVKRLIAEKNSLINRVSELEDRLSQAEPEPSEPKDEPVAWMFEDELPPSYPYDKMFEHSEVRGGVRVFPVYTRPALDREKVETLRTRVKEMRDLLADSEELRGKVIDVAEQWRARAEAAERKLAEAYERAAMAVADEHLTDSTGTSDDIAYDTAIDHAVNAIRKLAQEARS